MGWIGPVGRYAPPVNIAGLIFLLAAIAWFVVLVRAASRANWWVVALYAGVAAGLADLLFVLLVVSPDGPDSQWFAPWSGLSFVAVLLALLSKNVRAVRAVGLLALLIGAAWAFVALRELFGEGGSHAVEFVWWAGLVAVHLMTFDAARRHTSSSPLAPYGQAFD